MAGNGDRMSGGVGALHEWQRPVGPTCWTPQKRASNGSAKNVRGFLGTFSPDFVIELKSDSDRLRRVREQAGRVGRNGAQARRLHSI